jgi:hypothetical protein
MSVGTGQPDPGESRRLVPDEALGEMAALTHELNNHLARAVVYAELLTGDSTRENAETTNRVVDAISRAADTARRLQRLVAAAREVQGEQA